MQHTQTNRFNDDVLFCLKWHPACATTVQKCNQFVFSCRLRATH